MSTVYVQNKIKEALKEAKGNPTRARQYLISWATQDLALLLGLTKSHLNGLASYAIAKTMQGETLANTSPKQAPPANAKKIDIPEEAFGKDLLKALSGRDSVRFGMEAATPRPVGRRTPASESHIEIMKSLAGQKSSKTKKP